MATSPSFNWPEPDNTDLVKNGALAIRTAVDAIDTSMTDLLGGTTGQVLTKASGTDMDFTWATASGGSNTFYAGKNKIINGDLRINQRGVTTTSTDSAFTVDRFQARLVNGTTSATVNTFTPGAAPVSGYEFKTYLTLASSGQSATNAQTAIEQKIESVRSFANQTITVSFWAKAASGTPKIALELAQKFGTGGTPSGDSLTYGGQVTISTSWVRYSLTVAVPSISGKTLGTTDDGSLSLKFYTSAGSDFNARVGSLGIQSATIDLTGFQAEAGSTATDFQTATGTIQGELAACQRYFWRAVNGTGAYVAMGQNYATTNGLGIIQYPVTMRVGPSVTVSNATHFSQTDSTAGSRQLSAFSADSFTNTSARLTTTCGAFMTAGNATLINSTNASATLDFGAEL